LSEEAAIVAIALHLTDVAEKLNRMGDARESLERARAVDPANADVRARLERVYTETGAFHELAEMSLEDARVATDAAVQFGHLIKAGSYFLEQGEPEEAVASLEAARALRPTDGQCVVLLADAYMLSDRADDANELLTAAVAAHKGRRSRDLAALYHRL